MGKAPVAPEELDLITPMLANGAEPEFLDKVEDNEDWIVGTKYDGFRCFFYIGDDRNWLITRGNKDMSDNVPQLRDAPLSALSGTVLDTEAIASSHSLWDTKSILGALPQRAISFQKSHGELKLILLDLPRVVNQDIMVCPWFERRATLWSIMEQLRRINMNVMCEQMTKKGKLEWYERIVKSGGEGVVAKNVNGLYQPGVRSKDWIKVKRVETEDVVIMGFIPVGGKGVVRDRVGHEGAVGAIEYGLYDSNGELKSVGRAGGLEDEERLAFAKDPDAYIGKVMEISGQAVGKGGAMRHPRFVRIRDDKSPEECIHNV